jgi:phosphoribosylanthranilate isomerase
VRTVEPYAVDVSSGVERQPGIKDHKKISNFIKNAKDVRT